MNFKPVHQTKRKPAVVDLTPLIDVTFQLLIFFLLTSSYVSPISEQRAAIEIDLAEATKSKQAGSFEGFRVSVSRDGQIYTNQATPVSVAELEIRLLEIKRTAPKTIVFISGDKSAQYGRVARILELVQSVGLPASVDFKLAQ